MEEANHNTNKREYVTGVDLGKIDYVYAHSFPPICTYMTEKPERMRGGILKIYVANPVTAGHYLKVLRTHIKYKVVKVYPLTAKKGYALGLLRTDGHIIQDQEYKDIVKNDRVAIISRKSRTQIIQESYDMLR